MSALRLAVLVGILAMAAVAGSEEKEKSRSPFSRSPADVAKDEPCRFMGTFHKESRRRIEAFLNCEAISLPEWKCMAKALKVLDDEVTGRCKQAPQSLEAIEVRQRELYRPCLPPSSEQAIRCSLLSTERTCLEDVCSEDPG